MRGPRLKFFANKQGLEQASRCFRCGAGFVFLNSMVATQWWLSQMSCNHTARVEYFSGRLLHCQSRNQSQAIFSRLLNSGNQTEYLKCRLSGKAFYGDPKPGGAPELVWWGLTGAAYRRCITLVGLLQRQSWRSSITYAMRKEHARKSSP